MTKDKFLLAWDKVNVLKYRWVKMLDPYRGCSYAVGIIMWDFRTALLAWTSDWKPSASEWYTYLLLISSGSLWLWQNKATKKTTIKHFFLVLHHCYMCIIDRILRKKIVLIFYQLKCKILVPVFNLRLLILFILSKGAYGCTSYIQISTPMSPYNLTTGCNFI